MNQMANDYYPLRDLRAADAGEAPAAAAAAPDAAAVDAPALEGAPRDMHHGLSEDVIGSPVSVEEAFQGSLRGMLSREIGAYIAATFLLGTGDLVRWEGTLYEVGNNYLVIYQQDIGRYVVGDINSLRFVEFSENGSPFALASRPCTTRPAAW